MKFVQFVVKTICEISQKNICFSLSLSFIHIHSPSYIHIHLCIRYVYMLYAVVFTGKRIFCMCTFQAYACYMHKKVVLFYMLSFRPHLYHNNHCFICYLPGHAHNIMITVLYNIFQAMLTTQRSLFCMLSSRPCSQHNDHCFVCYLPCHTHTAQ